MPTITDLFQFILQDPSYCESMREKKKKLNGLVDRNKTATTDRCSICPHRKCRVILKRAIDIHLSSTLLLDTESRNSFSKK